MPQKLPPGLPFVARSLAVNLLPAVLVFALVRTLRTFGLLDARFSQLWVVLAAVVSIPTAYAGRIMFSRWSVKRRAARMGAVLPPKREGKSLGNVDILTHSMEMFRRGYPGASIRRRSCARA